MLLAVLDLIASGEAKPDAITWNHDLRSRFAGYFAHVARRNDRNTPGNPFRRLQTDGFWAASLLDDQGRQHPLNTEPTVEDARRGRVKAALKSGFERLAMDPASRKALREALISRFFPDARAALESLFWEPGYSEPSESESKVAEDSAGRTGRDSAFRRKVIAAYDYQCAACGLRIRIPQPTVFEICAIGNREPDQDPILVFGTSSFDSET